MNWQVFRTLQTFVVLNFCSELAVFLCIDLCVSMCVLMQTAGMAGAQAELCAVCHGERCQQGHVHQECSGQRAQQQQVRVDIT